MLKKIIFTLPLLTIAFAVLFISVFRTAAVSYNFEPSNSLNTQNQNKILGVNDVNIDYYLPYPGRVLPDSVLWPLKAMRDRVWLWVTTNQSRKAELRLLFADKRLGAAKVLFDKGNSNQGLTTLTKAEKYLEEASQNEQENRRKGNDTTGFMSKLSNASLKHYQVILEMISIAPEEVRPLLINIQAYPKKVYEDERNGLLEQGKQPPQNPFNWQ